MKKYLLPKLNPYKANLHCHSTISDGELTPEEIKTEYMKKGYSAVAYTDHEVMVDHKDLCDENFIALNGVELEARTMGTNKRTHLCLIAKSQENRIVPCYNKSRYVWGRAEDYRDIQQYVTDDYIRSRTPECVNDMIKRSKELGYFVTFNHPAWSIEVYPEYSQYRGMDAIEVENHGSISDGFPDKSVHVYDDLLKLGVRLNAIAADDNHNHRPIGTPNQDSFGGWTVLFAESLSYENLISALEKGNFYCSAGPDITELSIENKTVQVKTSGAHRINLVTGNPNRHCENATAFYGDVLHEASFELRPDDVYFRIEVENDYGKTAYSNAFFLDSFDIEW